jgi:hypothetical protein
MTFDSHKTKLAPLIGVFKNMKGATKVQDNVITKRPDIVHEGDLFICLLPCLFLFVGWLCLFQGKK